MLCQQNAGEYERKRECVVETKCLAKNHHRKERAEDRHQIDEQARPPGTDQFDAAHEALLCDQRRPKPEKTRTPQPFSVGHCTFAASTSIASSGSEDRKAPVAIRKNKVRPGTLGRWRSDSV